MKTSKLLAVALLSCLTLGGEPVAVRFVEGSVHGFLVLRSSEGKVLAAGDLTQVLHDDRVTAHLMFRFKDGSVHDETSVFTERGHFKLISDHLMQKGPAFAQPIDLTVDATTGQVTVRYQEKGETKVETKHLDLPDDLANGLILNVLKNIPDAQQTTLSLVAATPKPRLVKLRVTSPDQANFTVAGVTHKAARYLIKVEIGGIEGLIAPLIGKEPDDLNFWILKGEVPAFVKSVGPLSMGGPLWTIEMTSPVWPQ